MRIGYVHYLYSEDGAENHVRQFVQAARALGHEVDEHAVNGQTTEVAAQHDARRRPLAWLLHDPKELLLNVQWVRREMRALTERRPDVVVARNHIPATSGTLAARRLGLPLVLEVNAPCAEARLYQKEYWHLPGVAPWLEGWKLRAADAVTVVSSSLRDHLVERHGVPVDKLHVVPNGADVERFRVRIAAPPRAGDAADDPVIGFVGSFQPWHGGSLLVELMLAVAELRPRARFVLAGDGPEAAIVRASTARLGRRATFLGRVPHADVPSIVAGFDIGVMPESNFYGSPLKVIEWMAAATAVVAPDYGPLRDVIDDGVHGLLFRQRSRDDLVAAVLRLIDDPSLRRRLGTAAAERVRTELTWTHNARRVLSACTRAQVARSDRARVASRAEGPVGRG